MPGRLRCGLIDLRANAVVRRLHKIVRLTANVPANWATLKVRGKYHFEIAGGIAPSGAGWYIICDAKRRPLYVGKADDLASRLNSDSGSRDSFANPKRATDPARNFIKAFYSAGLWPGLQVFMIPESTVTAGLGISGPLSDCDRGNIEKVISLFRERVLKIAGRRCLTNG